MTCAAGGPGGTFVRWVQEYAYIRPSGAVRPLWSAGGNAPLSEDANRRASARAMRLDERAAHRAAQRGALSTAAAHTEAGD